MATSYARMLGATEGEQPVRTRLRTRSATSRLSPLSLGDLALALHVATSFLRLSRYDLTSADEVAELRCSLLVEHEAFPCQGSSPTGHVQPVARTFALSSQRLHAADPIEACALAVLAGAARFAPISAAPARAAQSDDFR